MSAPPGMNPAVYDAMALTGEDRAYFHDDPEAPIPMRDQAGQEQQMDPAVLVAEGMARSIRHMASNGPTIARHIGKARQMTMGQLEEQRMNEKQGYPSNLDEAEKVKALESKVSNIETGISQILSHLSGQSSPASPESNVSTGGSPASLVEPQIPMPVPSVTVPPPNQKLTDLSESSEPENRQPRRRQVTLKDGRKVNVPATTAPANPMSLGPATDQTQLPTQLEEEDLKVGDDGWDDPIAVVPEPEQEVTEQTPAPKIAQTQQLVQDVNAFMQTNNVHRFWRRHISRSLHRHVGYNGWPKELQVEFDNRFKGFLRDPQFVTSICRKVISMEMGPAIGAKHVVSFLVATAGFTAFALCGLDG